MDIEHVYTQKRRSMGQPCDFQDVGATVLASIPSQYVATLAHVMATCV